MADQGPNYTPADAVVVVLTSTDFDLTVQFPGQKYAQRLAVGASGVVTVTYLSGRSASHTVTIGASGAGPVYLTGLFTKVVKATTSVAPGFIIAEM
jgi:hypothetical protein